VPEVSVAQISNQLGLAVDRVMTEGSLYDRELAALAIKQARGDMIEAIFLLRAYRTTLPRFRLEPSPSIRRRCRCVAASPRPSRTCRAARCWARPSTTRIVCSIRC
jgi:alpha-D-ribose 1-methylphosphonate 5-triphosphate synthase subunit PhnI